MGNSRPIVSAGAGISPHEADENVGPFDSSTPLW